jgi:hypothetical protein
MDSVRKYRIVLILQEEEAEALANLAVAECRDLRGQAHYLVREGLKLRETGCEDKEEASCEHA